MAKTGPHGPAEVPGGRPEPHNTQRSTTGPPHRAGGGAIPPGGEAIPRAPPGQAGAQNLCPPPAGQGQLRQRGHTTRADTSKQGSAHRTLVLFGVIETVRSSYDGVMNGLGFPDWLAGISLDHPGLDISFSFRSFAPWYSPPQQQPRQPASSA